MQVNDKVIMAENLVLLNNLVQKAGGVLNVSGSYTGDDGQLYLKVRYNVSIDEKEYLEKRVKGNEIKHSLEGKVV